MQLSDSSQIKKIKRDISKILTVKREREILNLSTDQLQEEEK